MKLLVLKERTTGEARVALTPSLAVKYQELDCDIFVESGAGVPARIPDELYTQNKCTIIQSTDLNKHLKEADIILKIRKPESSEIAAMKKGAIVLALMEPYQNQETILALQKAGVSSFALELTPRITRAQAMDVLSSQSNLAGYKAVIDAAELYAKAFPMMMTAAGTITPARTLILGAGVAGLQAIATARRLGAVVSAFDVRPAAKEQVESLGATFVMVEDDEINNAETSGGYAKEMSKAYQEKQKAKIHETLKKQDIAICTALIPGKKAPVLITEDMVKDMKPGSIIIDMAAGMGGNCTLSEPDKVVEKHNVTILGYTNYPSRIAHDASQLFAKNMLNFVSQCFEKDTQKLLINLEDEIIKATLLTHNGALMQPQFVVDKPAAVSQPKPKSTPKPKPTSKKIKTKAE